MTIQDVVQRGATWLDEVAPGWEDKIDPNQLIIASTRMCVLGQLVRADEEFAERIRSALREALIQDPWMDPSLYYSVPRQELSYDHVAWWARRRDRYWRPCELGFAGCLSYFSEELDRAWKALIAERIKAKQPKRTDFVLAS